MALRRKKDKFKHWLTTFFVPKEEIQYISDVSQRLVVPAGFFGHAQDFALHNCPMTSIHGNQYTYIQGDRNVAPQIMSLLSQHIIQGAAHDDSARTPPPRCHPDTRLKAITRITAWSNGQAQQESLLWITGPAGVGKSAIVQTFAEYLVKSKSLGASVFISRPNKRNNPHGIFITIAYQLATRIEEYLRFIVERLSLDPSLLNKDMEAQFLTFIVEPFVEKKLGTGGKRWGILLDGLDELQGEDAQCNIIQLISTFVQEHPDAPLLWIIASRPESHICNTFDDDEVRHSHWSEYIPIDSTEACEDVERFLRSSFQVTKKKFRHSTPSDWPSDTDFLKLTAAASGLFVYAEVVMEFIRDPDYADPASRLEVLLSVIDRSTAIPTKENPFVHLDMLYHEILSSIPLTLWQTTKRLLAFTIYQRNCNKIVAHFPRNFWTFRGMSILFSLSRHTIYACLTKCRSILKIPDWKAAHKERLTFLHASFSDYLEDPNRSGGFYVGNLENAKQDVLVSLFGIWNRCSGDDIATASVESAWNHYCSNLDDKSPLWAIAKFHATLFKDLIYCLEQVIYDILAGPTESLAYMQLRKVHVAKLCYYFGTGEVMNMGLLMGIPPDFNDTGLCREIQLRELKFGHLDCKEMSPVYGYKELFSKAVEWLIHRPHSKAELKAFVSKLENLQEHSPELQVFVFGGVPKWRVAVFCYGAENEDLRYVIPYPE